MISKRPVNTSEPEPVTKTTVTASEPVAETTVTASKPVTKTTATASKPVVETTVTASKPESTSGERIEIDILIVRTDEDGGTVEESEDEFTVGILISVYQRKKTFMNSQAKIGYPIFFLELFIYVSLMSSI